MGEKLHVILCHFNPRRLAVRTRLFKETAKRLEKSGAKVWRVEVAFADRPFEVTVPLWARHIRLRTSSELWLKEAQINAAVERILKLYPKAKYVAWIDADVEFVNPNWVSETIAKLDHHPVVQMFSNAIDMTPKFDFMQRSQSFARLWGEGHKPGDFETNKAKYPTHMHPGYCWAFRADVWKKIGGMPTFGILGSGDHQMACGLVGKPKACIWPKLSPGYGQAITDWAERAYEIVQGDIGFVDGMILHAFHGAKENRGYQSRIDILRQSQFDPFKDLVFDKRGLPQIVGKPELRRAVAAYMGSRKEYDLTMALETRPTFAFSFNR